MPPFASAMGEGEDMNVEREAEPKVAYTLCFLLDLLQSPLFEEILPTSH